MCTHRTLRSIPEKEFWDDVVQQGTSFSSGNAESSWMLMAKAERWVGMVMMNKWRPKSLAVGCSNVVVDVKPEVL